MTILPIRSAPAAVSPGIDGSLMEAKGYTPFPWPFPGKESTVPGEVRAGQGPSTRSVSPGGSWMKEIADEESFAHCIDDRGLGALRLSPPYVCYPQGALVLSLRDIVESSPWDFFENMIKHRFAGTKLIK
jgi:hypothetical protein